MEAPGLAGHKLTVKQTPFSHEGFASTGELALPTNIQVKRAHSHVSQLNYMMCQL